MSRHSPRVWVLQRQCERQRNRGLNHCLRKEIFEESVVPEARFLLLRKVTRVVRVRFDASRRDLIEETSAPRCYPSEKNFVWVDQS